MFIDSTNLGFSASQAITVDVVSTNVIDLGVDTDIGVGTPVYVAVVVEVAPDATTGDETYIVQVQSGSTATPTDLIGSISIPRTAKKGDVFYMPIPSHSDRYMRLNYDVGGTTPTITVSAFLTTGVATHWVPVGDNS